MKKYLSVLIAFSMVLSSFAVPSLIYLYGQTQTNQFYNAPQGTVSSFNGSVTINANGSLFDGVFYSTANIDSSGVVKLSGSTYYLEEALNGSFTVLKSNSTFNGCGLTVGGKLTKSFSINICGVKNVTVENFGANSSLYGIRIESSNHLIIKNIKFINTFFGIIPCDSNHILIENSYFSTSQLDSNYFIDTSSNNNNITVTNNTICYYGCSSGGGMILEGNNMEAINNTIASSTSSTYMNEGIEFICSHNDSSVGNHFQGNLAYALHVCHENGVTIDHNYFDNAGKPFEMESSKNVTLNGNNIAFNGVESCVNLVQNLSIVNTSISGGCDPFVQSLAIDNSSEIYIYNDSFKGTNIDFAFADNYVYVNKSCFEGATSSLIFSGVENNINIVSSKFLSGTSITFNSGSSISDLLIYNNTVNVSTHYIGVCVLSNNCVDNFNVIKNRFYSTNAGGGTGIYLSHCTNYVVTGLVIFENIFDNLSLGVFVNAINARGINISNNTILNSGGSCSTPSGFSGIYVSSSSNGLVDPRIDGNVIQNSSYNAIYVLGALGLNVSNNYVNNSALPSTLTHQTALINLVSTSFSQIFKNKILFPFGSVQCGIIMSISENDKVTENCISKALKAIYLKEDFIDSSVQYNYLSGGTNGLIIGSGSCNFTVTQNTIYNFSTSLYVNGAIDGYIFNNLINRSISLTAEIVNSKDLAIYHNNFFNRNMNNVTICSSTNIAWNLSTPIGGNYWSNYNHSGTDGFGSVPYVVNGAYIDYLPLTKPWSPYSVVFAENGLPVDTSWKVYFGSSMEVSNSPIITFPQAGALEAQVKYSVPSIIGYVSSSLSGSINLTGQNQTISVEFTPYLSTLSFKETGNPNDSVWAVSVDGSTLSSTSSTISFDLLNGTYNYSITSEIGFTSSGSVNVSGSTLQNIEFPVYYNLTVTEKGLSAGASWEIYLNNFTFRSTSSVIIIPLVRGNYSISASGPAGYSVSIQTSYVTIDHANVGILVNFQNESDFVIEYYTVSFVASGKPSSSVWSVDLNGSTIKSQNSTISFVQKNGTYNYSVMSSVFFETSSYVKIAGNNLTRNIQFPAVYKLTVNETGLSNMPWTFYLNGTPFKTSLTSIVIYVIAGNYSVSASGPSGYTVTINQPFLIVQGGNSNLNVSFAEITNKPPAGISLESIAIGSIVGFVVGIIAYAGITAVRTSRKGKS